MLLCALVYDIGRPTPDVPEFRGSLNENDARTHHFGSSHRKTSGSPEEYNEAANGGEDGSGVHVLAPVRERWFRRLQVAITREYPGTEDRTLKYFTPVRSVKFCLGSRS